MLSRESREGAALGCVDAGHVLVRAGDHGMRGIDCKGAR
jgi:hypothetical protein